MRAEAASAPPPDVGRVCALCRQARAQQGRRQVVDGARSSRLDYPLVIIGDGPERGRLEARLRGAGRPVMFKGWLAGPAVLAWMRRAQLLVFPSQGPESLSRVLLEAAALGVPIAAMETGGTRRHHPTRSDGSAFAFGGGLARRRRTARPRSGSGCQTRRQASGRTSQATFDRRASSADRVPLSLTGAHRLPMVTDQVTSIGRRFPPGLQHDRDGTVRPPAASARRAGAPRRRSGAASAGVRRARHAHHAPCVAHRGRRHGKPRGARQISRRCRASICGSCRTTPFRSPDAAARRHRSKHRVSVVRPARRAAGGSARPYDGRADLVHGLGASALGYATARRRDPRHTAPFVFNPQGLEEFGAAGALDMTARLKRLAYKPLQRAVLALRRGRRPHHRDRSRARPSVLEHLMCRAIASASCRTPSTSSAATPAGPAEGLALRRRVGLEPDEPLLLSASRIERNKGFHVLVEALARPEGSTVAMGTRRRRAVSIEIRQDRSRDADCATGSCCRAASPTRSFTRGTRPPPCSCIRRSTKAVRSSRWKRCRTAARSLRPRRRPARQG